MPTSSKFGLLSSSYQQRCVLDLLSSWTHSLELLNVCNSNFNALILFRSRRFSSTFSPQNEVEISEEPFNHSGSSSVIKDNQIETVYKIINTQARDGYEMAELLEKAGVSLSTELIDGVLKRVRFSHGSGSQAFEFFCLMARQRGFFHSSYSYDTMLYILGRERKFEKVWGLLREMRIKDQSLITPRTLQIVLARIAKACSVRQTVESFTRILRYSKHLDSTDSFNALLRTLCQEKSMGDARNVYHSLKRSFRPNILTFNILLSGWKTPQEAESFFGEMIELGCKPDLVSYNCLVDALCKGRELDKALKIVQMMREKEIYPDVMTYTSIIGGLGLMGQPDKACEVLKEMREHGCYPDTPAYNAAIRNFCIARRLGDAYRSMDEMVMKGLSPNPTTYNLFFRCFYQSNDLSSAWSMYQRMMETGCLPNTQTCMFLIKLFKRQEKLEMSLRLWNDMVERGFGSYTLVSDILFDMLCDLGKLIEVEKCFLQMIDKGQKPSNAAFKRIKVLMELANRSSISM
ncbi:putative pentatricopeptide repeat-containing protein At1g02420 [Amborella trichopoda]|uniref:putative pentatricopeptide repeat-containing protein At1g02420 n=1 Tax=Amborella trichopoda TaxID=13333 RepID=UPI0009C141BA|nr:putative pentatricopeptide repeat-containing protein At1g02420 [Amborella trichopoda]|eukprot:XP_020521285.1 putative pentatricopeptide repeat-containing protein At1g02420 [Amborella trichopoda]